MKKAKTPEKTPDDAAPEPAVRRSPAASLPMADTIRSIPGSRLKKR